MRPANRAQQARGGQFGNHLLHCRHRQAGFARQLGRADAAIAAMRRGLTHCNHGIICKVGQAHCERFSNRTKSFRLSNKTILVLFQARRRKDRVGFAAMRLRRKAERGEAEPPHLARRAPGVAAHVADEVRLIEIAVQRPVAHIGRGARIGQQHGRTDRAGCASAIARAETPPDSAGRRAATGAATRLPRPAIAPESGSKSLERHCVIASITRRCEAETRCGPAGHHFAQQPRQRGGRDCPFAARRDRMLDPDDLIRAAAPARPAPHNHALHRPAGRQARAIPAASAMRPPPATDRSR